MWKNKMPVDYTLYLVTDRGILKGKDLFGAIEEAIAGGVTLVQLREKSISSLDFYHIALRLKKITGYHRVPLIINDRLDIALAVDADGLHIGQEDLPLREARRLLGEDKILGYSVSTVEEAVFGQANGADYLGAGPVYPTGSKADAAPPTGTGTLKNIKDSVSLPVVAIGGISEANTKEVKASGVDGVSVISAILGSADIKEAAGKLAQLWKG